MGKRRGPTRSLALSLERALDLNTRGIRIQIRSEVKVLFRQIQSGSHDEYVMAYHRASSLLVASVVSCRVTPIRRRGAPKISPDSVSGRRGGRRLGAANSETPRGAEDLALFRPLCAEAAGGRARLISD